MRKRKVVYSLLTFFVFSAFIFLALKLPEFFRIRKVYIIANKTEISGLYELNGGNLLTLDENKMSSKLKEMNPLFKSVTLKKTYPDSLLIIPEMRTPVARIKYGDKVLLVDEEASILPLVENNQNDKSLISIVNIPVVTIGKADWRVGRTLTLFDQSKRLDLGLNRVEIDGNFSYFRFYTDEGTEIIIPNVSDMYKIAASLQIIFNRFRIEGKNIAKIDLQFEKPIIILDSGEKISSL